MGQVEVVVKFGSLEVAIAFAPISGVALFRALVVPEAATSISHNFPTTSTSNGIVQALTAGYGEGPTIPIFPRSHLLATGSRYNAYNPSRPSLQLTS